MKDNPPPFADSPKEQAGYWLVRQHSGTWTQSEEQRFQHWLAESLEHRLAYQQMQELWQGLGQFQHLSPQLMGRLPQPKRAFQSVRWASGLALANLLLGFLLVKPDVTYIIPAQESYTTAKGEQQTLILADGSEVILNGDSEIQVAYDLSQRRVSLRRGEALFKVAHRPMRQFTVAAGSGEIIDIGTQFDVNLMPERVVVTVTEGSVAIHTTTQQAPTLSAGQRLSYNAKGIVSLPDKPELASITAWQHGRLVFDMTPLAEAVAQMARYHKAEFVFDNPKLKQLKVSGSFLSQDLNGFLKTLENLYPLRASQGKDKLIHLQSAGRG